MRNRNCIAITTFLSTVAFAAASSAAAPSFSELDQNKDGLLSKEGASKVEQIDFSTADRNRDGMLDRVEYEKAVG